MKIPKSKNNGNYNDYVYLDMLDGDNVQHFLSFEKKSMPRKSNENILKLLEKNRTYGKQNLLINLWFSGGYIR